MAKQFYFLISSLPMLRFGSPPALSSERFLETVAAHAGEEPAQRLTGLSLVPSTGGWSAAVRFWNERETYIRNYVLQRRVADTADATRWQRPCAEVLPSLDHQLREALLAPSPLERERRLDMIRWQMLDEALLGREFTIDALVAYRLRLLLAEKWQRLAADQGRKMLDALIDTTMAQARGRRTTRESHEQDSQ
jgi:hypothetical protein